MTSLRTRLLIATPELIDPNFYRSVIYILEHNEEGAMGLVLNRTFQINAEEAIPRWAERLKPPKYLHCGGPVSESSLLGIANIPSENLEGAVLLLGTIGILDLHKHPDELPGVDSVRLFSGYTGWTAGQLDSEIAVGGWIVVDAKPEDLLTNSPQKLWSSVLHRQKGLLGLLSAYPDDPSVN
tara:strand:+ start:61 stop:606 length:546 start_codon:yes stop_codon:yes gene_type:complete